MTASRSTDQSGHPSSQFLDTPVSVRARLVALWAALLFCFIYIDIFAFFQPGTLQETLAGHLPPLGDTTEGALMLLTTMMVIPILLIPGSLLLPVSATRVLNMMFGALYAVVPLTTMAGSWMYYKALSALVFLLGAAIVIGAWKWPRQESRLP
jgi:Family of unknown function (DUF6326)